MADPRFDSCRFDFRLDSKNGLTPSKRKKSERRGTCYNTLFKCKVCGSLFDNRASLLEHKLVHNDYKCPICGVKVARKATLREHLQVIHGLGKDKASPEELEEEKVHKINMKEQMNVVRGMVNRKTRGNKGGTSTKLAPKPQSDCPSINGPAVTSSTPSSTATPANGSSPVASSQTTPTTLQGYMCINVPIFVPSSSGSTSNSNVEASTSSIPPQSMLLPMMTALNGSAAPVPILPMPPAPPAPPPHMLLPVTHAPPQSSTTLSQAGASGAMTVPVNSANTSIVVSTPSDRRTPPSSGDVPPLIPAQTRNSDHEPDCLEPGEIWRPQPQLLPKEEGQPVIHVPPSPVIPPDAQMASIAIKCEDGQVRFFRITPKNMVPPSPQIMPQIIHIKPEVNEDGQPEEARKTSNGVLDLVMRKDEDGVEEWRNVTTKDEPQDLSVKSQVKQERFMISEAFSSSRNSLGNQSPNNNNKDEVIDLSIKSSSSFQPSVSTPSTQDCPKAGRKRGLDSLVNKLWQTKIKENQETPTSRSVTPIEERTPPPNVARRSPLSSSHTPSTSSTPLPQYVPLLDTYPQPPKRSKQQNFFSNKFHTCKVCRQLFENVEDMWEHAVQHEEFHRLRCNVCDYKAPSITDMVKHNYQEHGEMFPPTPNPLVKSTVRKGLGSEEYFCSVCGIGFTDTTQLRDHVLEHNEEGKTEFICEYDRCKLVFDTKKDLWFHIERDHLKKLNPKNIQCPQKGCDRKFASMNHLKRHMVAHCDDRPIACAFPGCEKTFKEVQNLRKHQSKHSGHAPSRCVLCNYACEEPSQMSSHMKERHWMDAQVMLGASIMDGVLEEEEPPLPEDAHETPPVDERQGAEQEQNRKGETRAESPSGSQSGTSKSESEPAGSRAAVDSRSGYFTTVMKIRYNTSGQATLTEEKSSYHPTESKLHVCKICKMMFETAQKMWSHRLVEHDELNKMYCELCGFSTESRLELETHAVAVHHQELPETKDYTCCWCGKVFQSRHGFRHHVLKHSEEGPPQYPCPMDGCMQTFASRVAIKLHIRQVHPQTGSTSGSPVSTSPASETSEGHVMTCDFPGCDKTFRETKHLKVHKMLHTDEKPLKCQLCDYSCRQRNSMNWHMKSKHNMQKQVTQDGRTIYV